jgi:hypothetical protein
MGRGDSYYLLPPDCDIRHVRTSSEVPRVSSRLLRADGVAMQRHLFDVEDEVVELFQSHYTNVRCETALSPPEDHGHSHSHGHH